MHVLKDRALKEKTVKSMSRQAFEGFTSTFHRYLKQRKYTAFKKIRKCFEARSKQLKKEGKGNRPNAAHTLIDEEIDILYKKNLPTKSIRSF